MPDASRALLDEVRSAAGSAEMQLRVSESPHAFFRFVNRSWMRAVCEAFRGELNTLPSVRLHGDAHVEQYGITGSERGLDDFDDSATGPAVIDLVRFLGSAEIAAEQLGWGGAHQDMADAFLRGYRQGLEDPTYSPPDPSVVVRLRAGIERSPLQFLAWAESLMQPLPADDQASFDAKWPELERIARQVDPSATPSRLRVKRVGWTRMGIGSAMARKVLVRVEGPSAAPEDDVIVEGKEVTTLQGIACLSVPASGELFRVAEGISQVGRLKHRMLIVVPLFPPDRPQTRGWWFKTWESAYRELEIADLASAEELAEVAHDVGAQLGSTNIRDVTDALSQQRRALELANLARFEPRIRQVAHDLAAATVAAWEAYRAR